MGSKSSEDIASWVIGSFPSFSLKYFSITRFSKTCPDFFEMTGSSGVSPETKWLILK
jgi:hypothetical protein